MLEVGTKVIVMRHTHPLVYNPTNFALPENDAVGKIGEVIQLLDRDDEHTCIVEVNERTRAYCWQDEVEELY